MLGLCVVKINCTLSSCSKAEITFIWACGWIWASNSSIKHTFRLSPFFLRCKSSVAINRRLSVPNPKFLLSTTLIAKRSKILFIVGSANKNCDSASSEMNSFKNLSITPFINFLWDASPPVSSSNHASISAFASSIIFIRSCFSPLEFCFNNSWDWRICDNLEFFLAVSSFSASRRGLR